MKAKTGPKKAKQPTDTTNKILVNVLLDKSGSMTSTRAETIIGYNVYVNKLREDKATDYQLTLVQFDLNQGPELTVTYENRPLADVKDLTMAEYEPRGGTPLYDAIGEAIKRVPADATRAKIMVVITDGEENSSKEFTKESVKALIKGKEAEGWTFVFLGSDIDAYQVGGAVGASIGNTANYNKANTVSMFAANARATMTRSALYNTVGLSSAVKSDYFSPAEKTVIEQDTVSTTVTTLAGGPQAGRPTFRVTKTDSPSA